MLMFILTTWIPVFFLMLFFWTVYLWLKNPGVIDVAWGIAITLTSIFYLFKNENALNFTQTIFLALLCLWCTRLSGYLLFTRIIPGHLEKRYEKLSEGWTVNKKVGYFFNYQLQGLLAIIIASPFIQVAQLRSFDVYCFLAILMIIVGLVGETMADRQLQSFRKNNPGKVCDIGLWQYSRHPNYFFEVMIWLGFSIAALATPWGFLALLSPLLLLFIMLGITGPLTEKCSIASKGKAYLSYQKKTSMFIPWRQNH